MSAFTHLDAGTPESRWLTGPLHDVAAVEPPGADAVIVVVSAHPDDETLGAGGLMAVSHTAGATLRLIVATDGEASHPDSPTVTPDHLAVVRRAELQRAVDVLAPDASVDFLALPDGRLADHIGDLVARVDALSGGATLMVCPWTGDGHPDHEAVGAAVAQVAARRQLPRWQFPIWAWHWGEPDSDPLPWQRIRRLSLSSAAARAKADAMRCHVSQHSALSPSPGDEALLREPMLAHFARPFETFVVDPAPDASDPAYFDALYASSDDPWGLADRFYEQRKRAVLMAALPRPRFTRAFEPGCALGLLTEQLAQRCDRVVAWDAAPAAVEQAAARVRDLSGVEVGRGVVPDEWPDGSFDLVVLSEVAYYSPALDLLLDAVDASLTADGALVACHWRHTAPAHAWSGEQVHAAITARPGLLRTVHHVEDDFVLDVWTRTGRSVAAENGVLG